MKVFFNGQILEKQQVAISPDDRGFLFADGVYEVVRSYRGCLFRWADHLARLTFGLNQLRIAGCDPGTLLPVMLQLLKENALGSAEATVYIQVTRGCAPRSHKFPPRNTPPTVYVEAKPFSPPDEAQQHGVAAIVVPDQRWARCDLKTVGLLANTLAFQQADEAGAFEAIFSRDGVLQEGTRSSILFVKDGILVCPPLTNYILPSVTRVAVLEAAAAELVRVLIRPCFADELFDFDEVLMVGTTAEVTPIVKVDGRPIGQGTPGPMARRLQNAFRKAVLAACDS